MFIKWDNDRQTLQLPVIPQSFEINGTCGNTSVIVQNLGEISLKGKRNLKTISFSSFFPKEKYSFCACEPMPPYDYIKKIEQLIDANETVHFIIPGTSVSIFCTIETFVHGEKGIGDVDYSLSLKEYKEITVNRISKTVKDKSYVWKKGDTWGSVAKKQTGNSSNAQNLKKINASVIKKAKKQYEKKHKKTAKATVALVGYKVVIRA